MQANVQNQRRLLQRSSLLIALIVLLVAASTRLRADDGICSGVNLTIPFTDVAGDIFFCTIAEAYFSGLTNGTTPTTYSPNDVVSRGQMSAFITRTLDQSLRRGSRRAALRQWWTPQSDNDFATTAVGSSPESVQSDGEDLWVANIFSGHVSRVHGSDGRLLGTWTGAGLPVELLVAKGRIYVVGTTSPGKLYQIDPTQPPGAMTTVATLGNLAHRLAFDGSRIWSANFEGSVSIVTFGQFGPFVSTLSAGFGSLSCILYDGANIWVGDSSEQRLKKLDANGNIIQSILFAGRPSAMVFDGTNIWVANQQISSGIGDTVTVVRAATGQVVATLSGNGLNTPYGIAFDGERVMVSNLLGNSVSLWRATDLAPLGSYSTGDGTDPRGVCSDGLNFWIALSGTGKLARF